MISNPKLSITVLSYNNDLYIKDCLASLMRQGIDDYEVFVIDDGSTDNSVRVINEFIKDKPKFKLIEKENSGGAISSQMGIAASTGEYCAIVDSDDIVADYAYKRLIERIESDGSDFAAGMPCKLANSYMFSFVSENEAGLFATNRVLESESERAEFSRQGFYWNCVFKTDFIKDNDIRMPDNLLVADRAFVYKALMRAKKISIDAGIVYYWRQKMNPEKASITDLQTEFFMVADRCDSFLAQLRVAVEDYENETSLNRTIWANSFVRLYYPLYSLFVEKNEDSNSEVDYKKIEKFCKRYRELLMEFPPFYENLIASAKVDRRTKAVTKLILAEEYQLLYDFLEGKDMNADWLKIAGINRVMMPTVLDLTIPGIRVSGDRVLLDIQIGDKLKGRKDFKICNITARNRFFNNRFHDMIYDRNINAIDITELKPSSYVLRATCELEGEFQSKGFSIPKRFAKRIALEHGNNIYVYYPSLSVVKVSLKNSFALLENETGIYIYVNDTRDDVNGILFYNVENNQQIEIDKNGGLYKLPIKNLPKGTNILMYRDREGLYDTVDIPSFSNDSDIFRRNRNIVKKNRIEIERV